MSEDAVDALAEAWSSIDGKLEEYRVGKADPKSDLHGGSGHYAGYTEDAKEMIRRLERRGFKIVRFIKRDAMPFVVDDDD